MRTTPTGRTLYSVSDATEAETFETFDEPFFVGEVTLSESEQLRLRDEAVRPLSTLLTIAANERATFVSTIGQRLGLGPHDVFRIEDGKVMHIGRVKEG